MKVCPYKSCMRYACARDRECKFPIEICCDQQQEPLTSPQPLPVVQKGWKLVPIEPNKEMYDAVLKVKFLFGGTARNIYKAMVNAAPTPLTEAQRDESTLFEAEYPDLNFARIDVRGHLEEYENPETQAYWNVWQAAIKSKERI
jgi:hypothetical protein